MCVWGGGDKRWQGLNLFEWCLLKNAQHEACMGSKTILNNRNLRGYQFPTWHPGFVNFHHLTSKVARFGYCDFDVDSDLRARKVSIQHNLPLLISKYLTSQENFIKKMCQVCQVWSAKLKAHSIWRANLSKFVYQPCDELFIYCVFHYLFIFFCFVAWS